MKKTILLFSVLMTAVVSHAQTYFTGWDNTAEQTGWTEYRLGAISPFYYWDYEANSTISAPNQLVHYYPVGGSAVTDDWFVSPVFNFEAGGSIDSFRYRFSGFGTPMTGDTVAVYLINGSQDPAQATSKQLLKIYQGADYQNDDMWRLQPSIAIPIIAGNSYIAFRYKTINNWLDTKFDNLKISYNFPASVSNGANKTNNVMLYPNPTNGIINIEMNDQTNIMEASLYDALGRKVPTKYFNGRLQTATAPSGFYVVHVHTDKGLFTHQVIIE